MLLQTTVLFPQTFLLSRTFRCPSQFRDSSLTYPKLTHLKGNFFDAGKNASTLF
ncbi:uncharacterized protein G2W53_015573 [Senna tora]|uniref:Uncharacterized protein n=1 Tax=Senna tora TaxID=362788 RepID=A0A834WV14_9FABA|nr:uncharacterized protein G2W53_015573 [Senna tora]